MSVRPIGIGIVGCGGIAQSHAAALKELEKQGECTVVGCADLGLSAGQDAVADAVQRVGAAARLHGVGFGVANAASKGLHRPGAVVFVWSGLR